MNKKRRILGTLFCTMCNHRRSRYPNRTAPIPSEKAAVPLAGEARPEVADGDGEREVEAEWEEDEGVIKGGVAEEDDDGVVEGGGAEEDIGGASNKVMLPETEVPSTAVNSALQPDHEAEHDGAEADCHASDFLTAISGALGRRC